MKKTESPIDYIFSARQLKEIIFGMDEKKIEPKKIPLPELSEARHIDEMQIDRLYLCL